ncbi:Protein prenyltransferase alpha subunit repeat-containing protein 1 [Habropoda laboriosa]|uniref:Protein prenyltransferase alpha subunit repeat-containing protein 1 n=1 Tax=Habropoda laboriosa TaxID=597456 RepID=A0A0L7RGC0_9HYME|nr:Protein prenyltransferase alpha subunit repeat-containing protein 1 [Habropoda laboriosa]
MQDDIFPAAEKILSDIENVLKKNPSLKSFEIIPAEDNENKSPVFHQEDSLGLASWCVQPLYCYAHRRLFELRQNKHRREEPSTVARWLLGALLLNPDVTTFWNMRRELVRSHKLDASEEFLFSRLVLYHKPKCFEAFAYRRWLLSYILNTKDGHYDPEPADSPLCTELDIATTCADRYASNYHAWSHRRHWAVLSTVNMFEFKELPREPNVKCPDLGEQCREELFAYIKSNIGETGDTRKLQRLLATTNSESAGETRQQAAICMYNDHEALWCHRRFLACLLVRFMASNIRSCHREECDTDGRSIGELTDVKDVQKTLDTTIDQEALCQEFLKPDISEVSMASETGSAIRNNFDNFSKQQSLTQNVQNKDSELGPPFRRAGSLRLSKSSNSDIVDRNRLYVSSYDGKSSASMSSWTPERSDATPVRPARHSAPAIDAPAPEYLARNLLQLGCPAVSMPTPRGGVGSEPPQSSDSDEYSATHSQQQQQQSHGHGYGQVQGDVHNVPKVQVSGPPNNDESSSVVVGSAGSIGARSAPSTPLQVAPSTQQASQQSISGSQLTVAAANNPQPPRSPSHTALRCNDSPIRSVVMVFRTSTKSIIQEYDLWSNDIWSPKIRKKCSSHLSKPLSGSAPSMAAGGATQAPGKVCRSSSTSSPGSISSARLKKFHRHFSQVAADERVLDYYSCALVSDILLQGHLYITPNYFAFYSNVFGYVTKLLIPTASVLKISKERTARIIPNAVAVATEEERHVFGSLLSRESTFNLMKQVWVAALEPQPLPEILPLCDEQKLLVSETLVVDDSEVNPEENDSSMSESGTDLNSRPPTVCTDTDSVVPLPIARPSLPPPPPIKVERPATPSKSKVILSLFTGGLKTSTVITILIALLVALYVSAALMMIRIDRLHTAYLNHPFVSPERFTQDRLLHYLNTNLDQIVKVRCFGPCKQTSYDTTRLLQ